MEIFARGGDSWNGRLSPDGRYLLCGGGNDASPSFAVIDLQAADPRKREVLLAPGRSPCWIGPRRVMWVVSTGPRTADRWEFDLIKDAVAPTRDDPALVAGNDIDADVSGHWASCLVDGGRLTLDGRRVGFGFLGARVAGALMLSVKDARYFEVRRAGVLERTLALPARANDWHLSAAGHISYGKWWPARVITPSGVDRNATVTSWEVEGPPVWAQAPDGTWWAWRHAVRPGDGMPLVLGHPWDDARDTQPGITPCIVVEGIPAAYLHVVAADGRWLIAGGQGGHIAVHAVPLAAARVPVRDVAPPPKPPEPPAPPNEDEMNKPGVTIEHFDKVLQNGQRWSARTSDRNSTFVVETEFISKGAGLFSFHQRIINAAGEDRSGTERIVEVKR